MGCRVENWGVQLEVAGAVITERRPFRGCHRSSKTLPVEATPAGTDAPLILFSELAKALVSNEVLVFGYHLF